MMERIAAATVHGRYLAIPPETSGPAPLLVGFHGYAEDAETQIERLRAIPGSQRWLCISIQALHPFYQRSTNRVVANWMTRQDRERAIIDNLAWVATCLKAVADEWPTNPKVVFTGFSQGAAMTWRAAVATSNALGVVAVGGDVPPELTPGELARIPSALIARGTADEWYTQEKFAEDERRLRESSVHLRALEFIGKHEWPAEVTAAVSEFLRECCS